MGNGMDGFMSDCDWDGRIGIGRGWMMGWMGWRMNGMMD